MPVYEYRCEDGHVTESMRRVADRHESQSCSVCDKVAEFMVSAPSTPVLNPVRPVKRPKNM